MLKPISVKLGDLFMPMVPANPVPTFSWRATLKTTGETSHRLLPLLMVMFVMDYAGELDRFDAAAVGGYPVTGLLSVNPERTRTSNSPPLSNARFTPISTTLLRERVRDHAQQSGITAGRTPAGQNPARYLPADGRIALSP